jgi:peptidoglycan/LPS O-acetylase OafA/YrhL
MANRKRLLFLDILRVEAILLVVIYHLAQFYHIPPINKDVLIANVIVVSLGGAGVWLFLFVSGAALAYTHPPEKIFTDLKSFYLSRLIRIYPAFWGAIIFFLIVSPEIVNTPDFRENLVPILSGFTAWVMVPMSGPLGNGFWFISLIISLYLMYPFLSRFIAWSPNIAMAILAEISIISIVGIVMLIGTPDPQHNIAKWLPISNLVFFCAGIYLIRIGAYPSVITKSTVIMSLSAASFFIYLYHQQMFWILRVNPVVYLVSLPLVCWVAMVIDTRIHDNIRLFKNRLLERITDSMS